MTLSASVVIPTYRRPAELERCLRGLEQQSELPHEVVVAVRADDTETHDMLVAFTSGRLRLTEVAVAACNASQARNRAMLQCSGDVIAMLDDDTVPRPDWLAALLRNYEDNPAVGGVGGPDWFDGCEVPVASRPAVIGRVQWWGRRIGNHHRGTRSRRAVEWLKGANMSFRREAIRGGLFGENLRGDGAQFAEDVALSLRVHRAGWQLLYDPACAVDHYPGPLMAGVDHRGLADPASLANAAHNETVAMLGYLSPLRRVVFLAWCAAIGTKLLPGLAAAFFLQVHGSADAIERWRVVQRGRLAGVRTWLASRRESRSAPADVERAAGTKRVCLVTHLVNRSDGQGRVNYELTKYLARNGHDVTLVASAVQADLLREPGVSWIRIPVPGHGPVLCRWALFALGVRWKMPASARRAFDIVHLNGAIAPVPADVNTSHFVHASWRRAAQRASRHDRLGGLYQRLVTEISQFSERRAYRAATRVVAVSDGVRHSLTTDVGVPPSRLAVIHTGVDVDEFHPSAPCEVHWIREGLGLGSGDFLMLFVGDAKSTRKNLDLPLRALTHLPPRFHLAIVGGSDGGPYAEMALRLGVSDRTHFLGARHDVARCYRNADALVCAAHYEPASLVLLEAMASALPSIVSPDVGNGAFVSHGHNGFMLQSSDDVAGAVHILTQLAGDPALGRRIGRGARETALTLSWERMGRRYEELYRSHAGAA